MQKVRVFGYGAYYPRLTGLLVVVILTFDVDRLLVQLVGGFFFFLSRNLIGFLPFLHIKVLNGRLDISITGSTFSYFTLRKVTPDADSDFLYRGRSLLGSFVGRSLLQTSFIRDLTDNLVRLAMIFLAFLGLLLRYVHFFHKMLVHDGILHHGLVHLLMTNVGLLLHLLTSLFLIKLSSLSCDDLLHSLLLYAPILFVHTFTLKTSLLLNIFFIIYCFVNLIKRLFMAGYFPTNSPKPVSILFNSLSDW